MVPWLVFFFLIPILTLMALSLTPEFGIEIPEYLSYMDLRARAEAACATIKELEAHGLEVNPTDEDNDVAATLLTSYAQDVEKTSKTVSHTRTAELTPASLIQTNAVLKEFGQLIATHAAEVRNTVVNKLILETENPDGRIRIRALELLGKMTDVGLFTERKEITVTHQTTEELREKLREKLEVLKKNADGVYELKEETGHGANKSEEQKLDTKSSKKTGSTTQNSGGKKRTKNSGQATG